MITTSIFEKLGHAVTQAASGEEAVEICRCNPVDLILLDVEMSGIDGFETASRIRQQSKHWFPIIFLSGRTDAEFFVKGIRSGGDVYLFKPIIPEVLQAMINAMERISQSHQSLQDTKSRLESIAYKDALTGLVNRRGFDESLQLEMEKAKKDEGSLTLILLDIDKFKPYNDNLGHPAGDRCLQQVAEVLQSTMCRDADIVARYGGEEFGIILPKTDALGAKVVASRICDAFKHHRLPHGYSEVCEFVTVSGGYSVMNDEINTTATFLEQVDQSLYRAKKEGRNRIVG